MRVSKIRFTEWVLWWGLYKNMTRIRVTLQTALQLFQVSPPALIIDNSFIAPSPPKTPTTMLSQKQPRHGNKATGYSSKHVENGSKNKANRHTQHSK